MQRDALKRAGCGKIVEDTVSGGKVQRPGLERVQEALRSGDVLAVWRLDRLGRQFAHDRADGRVDAEWIGFQGVTRGRRSVPSEETYIDDICKAVGISRPTLYKYVAAASDI